MTCQERKGNPVKPSGILIVALLSLFSVVAETEERPSTPGSLLSATAEAGDLPGASPLGMHKGGASCGESILEVDVTSIESWDGLNDPDNTTLLQNLGEGTLMIGIGWDLTITPVGASWVDAGIYFDGQDLDASGLFLLPGIGARPLAGVSKSLIGAIGFREWTHRPLQM